MKQRTDWMAVITTTVCLLPILLSMVLYARLPAQLPIHFDSAGVADNYLPKAIVCYGLPAAFALLNLFTHFRMNTEPRRANTSTVMSVVCKWAIPVVSVVCVPFSLFTALGKDIPIQIILPALTGIMLILCGNYLPKSRQNNTIGIKLPWTLSSEDNWNKTHRLAGALWIVGGFVMLVASLLQWRGLSVTAAVALVLLVIPSVYSYNLYRRGI